MSNLFFSANGELMEQPGQPGNLVENMAHEDDHEDLQYTYDEDEQERFGNDEEDDQERFGNDEEDDQERFGNDEEDDPSLIENMSNEDQFDLKGSLNLSGGIKAKDFSTPDGKSLLKMLDQKNSAFNSRLNVNSGKDHIGLNVQSDTDSHIQLKTKNDDNKNVYLINRDGHFRVHQHGVGDMFGVNKDGHTYVNSGNNHIGLNVQSNADSHIQLKTKNDDNKNVYLINRDGHFRLHHHGVGDMFGVNKDGHTYINSGNNHLGLNVQSNTDSHILLRTKNDAKKDLYLINRDGHFRLHQGGVGDMFGVNKDGHHYIRHTGDHVTHIDGDGNNPYISLGKTGTWGGKKLYIQNVDAHTEEPIFRVGVHDKGPMMDMSLKHGARWRRKDGRWTHFDWVDNKNYIRGDTEHDNSLNVGGTITARNAIHLDQNIAHPDRGDGSIYRADGQVQIATDDLIRMRHVGSKQTGIQFDTRPGHGDIHVPNGEMKISRGGIMFGGPNNGKEHNSAQISAGQHVPNSLNIVGMSSGKGHQDRRVDMWTEGGLHLHGGVQANQGAWNGWISGNFGAHGKDRVVLGNLHEQATVGGHNNAMNAWTPLRLEGNGIHIVPQGGVAHVHGTTSLNGRVNLTHAGSGGDHDSDPYHLEKVRSAGNENSLRLTINDDANESFQIWGNSCGAGNCGGAGTMQHNFVANGNAEHRGDLIVHGNIRFRHPNGQEWVMGMRDPNHFAINKLDASGKNKNDGTGFLIRHDGHVWTGGGGFHHGSHDQNWYNHWQHNIHMGRR
jgi:hypothetical protein